MPWPELSEWNTPTGVYHVTRRGNRRKAIHRHDADRHEEIRWRRRADAEEAARAIELLIEQEGDRRVAIWLRVRLRKEPMTTVAAQYGDRDGSGADRVIKRLEEKQTAIAPCRAA